MIYIILPVHNRVATTMKFVHSLKAQAYKDYQVILVDDGCTDGTAEQVALEIPNLTVLRGDGGLWWAGSLEKARNHLLSQPQIRAEDIIVIANDDIIFDAMFLEHIVQDMRDFPNALILPKCYSQRNRMSVDSGVHVDWKNFTFHQAKAPENINVLSTRGLYMKYGIFQKIGGFHTILLPHYASDYEFTHRAYKKGFRLMISQRASVFVDPQTTGIRKINYDVSLGDLLDTLFFSKKSVLNCVMWTNFILLSCERRYIPSALFKKYRAILNILVVWLYRRMINLVKHMTLRVQIFLRTVSNAEIKVVLGSGGIRHPGWITTDVPHLDITDRAKWSAYFRQNSIDLLFAEHVWEHLSAEDARVAAEQCFSFLKPGGILRVAVPDGFSPDPEYIESVKPGGSGPGSEDHKLLYDHSSFSEIFIRAGFSVTLLEHWDEHGKFHRIPWSSERGHVQRSLLNDSRNAGGTIKYTSIILEAKKN